MTKETKFRKALKESIRDLKNDAPSCAFCMYYSGGFRDDCPKCPMSKLCTLYSRALNTTPYDELQCTRLMYLHWLYDNKITEKQMRGVNDG